MSVPLSHNGRTQNWMQHHSYVHITEPCLLKFLRFEVHSSMFYLLDFGMNNVSRLWGFRLWALLALKEKAPPCQWGTCATHENYSWLYSKIGGPMGNSVHWHMLVWQREKHVWMNLTMDSLCVPEARWRDGSWHQNTAKSAAGFLFLMNMLMFQTSSRPDVKHLHLYC